MFDFFKKRPFQDIHIDIHSHLIPSVDDGVGSIEESIAILRRFSDLGYKKVITTPHIYSDFYPNEENDLLKKLSELRNEINRVGLLINVELAAEYFINDHFLSKINNKQPLLTFGKRFVLVETSFQVMPLIWKEIIFELQIQDYKPVLAHPERYDYFISNPSLLREMKTPGVYFQLSLPSLVGAYGKKVQDLAEQLIRNDLVDFVGSDVHNTRQMEVVAKAMQSKLYRQLMRRMLINNEL